MFIVTNSSLVDTETVLFHLLITNDGDFPKNLKNTSDLFHITAGFRAGTIGTT